MLPKIIIKNSGVAAQHARFIQFNFKLSDVKYLKENMM